MNIDCSCVYFRKAECTHYKHPEKECWFLVNGKCNPKRKTNADRIRAMSDEDLAWELMIWRIETEAKHHGVESNYPNTKTTILEWLKQPAEVD